ncbi:hypothetical protein E5676_scaffold77438G00010 [Cucumis melo var. makuwa]|uniref:NADH dehydrogenase subunit 2 n=1 Tax=Cucumis melo var. makuwa TaxID=1194695 RepID=A0A5D3DTY2_CUCMM|nr:hypothetical protein E5676_scaffold77438G00010 [Cucumis melo var. makuwa]
MFNLFLAVSPEIFLINATFILLIHGVVFSTSKKDSYPPLVSNVGWLGLLSVARLGGQRALGCGGAIIAQLPNLMRDRVRAAGNRSMGGRLILLPPQGWLIVRSRLEDPWFWKAHESERYVECATDTTLRRCCRGTGGPSRAQDRQLRSRASLFVMGNQCSGPNRADLRHLAFSGPC